MTIQALIQKVEPRNEPLIAGLSLTRRTEPTQFEALIYQPIVCLILQGAKITTVGDRSVRVTAGQTIVVSHDLPVIAQVSQASAQVPYLSLVAKIDLSLLRSVSNELDYDISEAQTPSAFAVSHIDEPMLAVFERYVGLTDNPEEARILGPLVNKELHYRLLKADNGGMLRQLLSRTSHASNITRAIKILRQDFRARFEMDDLAHLVGMSSSSFYKHFKAVTSTTPLQYQKDLRLTEGRRLLLSGAHTVATAAFEVGYESPSQFSREYSRKFGTAPSRDLRAMLQ